VKAGVKINKNRFKKLKVRPCDPVFHLFFTTSRLSADAWELLDQSGVVGMDGEMLAAFLADREIGCSPSGFDALLFGAWVKSFEK
jgi:restriction endonuclease Mrr